MCGKVRKPLNKSLSPCRLWYKNLLVNNINGRYSTTRETLYAIDFVMPLHRKPQNFIFHLEGLALYMGFVPYKGVGIMVYLTINLNS